MKLWLTYAWVDKADKQVDFIVQTLQSAGLEVGIDRAKLIAGQRLWPQVAQHIESPQLSDAWGIVVSRNSLVSEACQEELAIALDRALRQRGTTFPIIGVFLERIEANLIPPAIRTRLYTSITDEDWVERVKAGVAQRTPNVSQTPISPFRLAVHRSGSDSVIVEAGPRAGRWRPCLAAVPASEGRLLGGIRVGPPSILSSAGALFGVRHGTTDAVPGHVQWTFAMADTPVDHQDSLFITLTVSPSILLFGSPQENHQITKLEIERA